MELNVGVDVVELLNHRAGQHVAGRALREDANNAAAVSGCAAEPLVVQSPPGGGGGGGTPAISITKNPKTQQRVVHTLETGKPLRN